MGGKLSKKGLNMAYEKPIAHVVEEATEAATGRPEEREAACPAAESMGPTTEKQHKDSQVPADEGDEKEGSGVPAVGVEEICKSEPRQLDLLPNEEQLVAISEETTKSPEADPSQVLEVTVPTGVESRPEGDAK